MSDDEAIAVLVLMGFAPYQYWGEDGMPASSAECARVFSQWMWAYDIAAPMRWVVSARSIWHTDWDDMYKPCDWACIPDKPRLIREIKRFQDDH